jgi:DNA (cytosine-5)-methyltransferase 1
MCLNAGAMGRKDAETETFIPTNGGAFDVAHSLCGEGFDASEDGTGRGTPLVPIAIQERAVSENLDAGPDGAGFRADGAAYTLEARQKPQAVAFAQNQRDEVRTVPVAGALSAQPGMKQQTYIAFDCKGTEVQHIEDGSHPTLRSMGHNRSHQNAGGHAAVATPWAVRRLTPRECERLQGFPDDFTLIPRQRRRVLKDKAAADELVYLILDRPKLTLEEAFMLAADGPRYKALGNSMAVPVVKWIMDRIRESAKQMGNEFPEHEGGRND